MRKGYIRMFISWLRLIVKTTAFRSCRSLLSVLLRLIRHCQSAVNGKEADFQERPSLALSSQPMANQPESTPVVSLAVPLLKAPLHTQGFQPVMNVQMPTPDPYAGTNTNDPTYNAHSPQHSIAPFTPISMPEPSIHIAIPSPPAAPGQTFDTFLIPIVPDQVKRYERNVRVDRQYKPFKVEKGSLDCSEELAAVEGWEPLTHPEGALFFYHPSKRAFTDADVRPETAVKLATAVEKAHEEARNANISLHPDSSVELALELIEEDGRESWGYYFADHEKRVIFWFEDYEHFDLIHNVRGVKRKSHVKYALDSQYCPFSRSMIYVHDVGRRHVELFPNRRFLPEDIVVTLKEIVMHAHAENITSDTCLAPFAPNEVADMLPLVDYLKGESFPDAGGSSLIVLSDSINKEREHSVWIAARFMRLFCNAKFVNFCGQPGARLDVDQSLYGEYDTCSKKIILRVMNVILFGSPDAQSKAIHRIWVDETIVQPRWKNFIDRLTTEWNGYTIFSTVMLAVDISFLAVPAVANQTPAIVLAYLSSLCAMGSLVVSLILAGQVNDSRRGSAADVASFMIGMSRSMLGLESLALMLSLPFALLIWGMAFFAGALSTLIFRTSGVVAVSITSPIWIAIFVLTTWPVMAANNIHVSQLRTWIIAQVLPQAVTDNIISHV
ncbi:hypothetical protein DEU56DRAFT_912107 [Suillus clintonianus]|uniref:uncharacterized protein n=1 Tax=Suillus clintonianus TaxID=1904413 RepID=UPI001B87EDBB|nr:uncharacterized protein DEU56DRAFT_912107 [Suillus clintonianus]KAG2139270.1 hypothetical protein DEU56DRAFT_912107 [Suillus clintonianus]